MRWMTHLLQTLQPHIAADGAADITDVPDRVDTQSVNVADRHATGDLSDKQTTDAARPPTQAVAESDPDAEQVGPLTDLWVDDA